MSDDTTAEPGGLSRRDMLRRSALVGGTMVWMTPAVQSLTSPAFAVATTVGGGNGTGLSEVTLLLLCGDTYYWAKYKPQTGSGVPTECSGNINVAESNSDLICAAGEQAMEDEIGSSPVASSGCLTGTVDGNGTLCVTYTGCTVEGWTVHDGSFGQVTHCAYFANGVVVGQPNGVGYSVTDNGTTICFSKL